MAEAERSDVLADTRVRFNSRVASGRDGRSRRHLGRFISEDAAVAVVKYFARPAGKGGAEINANAFHGLHPRPLYLAQRDARLGRIHMTSFGTLIQEVDIRRVQRTCSAQRGHGGASDVDVETPSAR